jgi:hypothetical protein
MLKITPVTGICKASPHQLAVWLQWLRAGLRKALRGERVPGLPARGTIELLQALIELAERRLGSTANREPANLVERGHAEEPVDQQMTWRVAAGCCSGPPPPRTRSGPPARKGQAAKSPSDRRFGYEATTKHTRAEGAAPPKKWGRP